MPGVGHGGTHFTSWAQELRSAAAGAPVPSVAYSPDTKSLALASGASVRCLAAATLAERCELKAPHGEGVVVRGVAYAGSDAAVATVGDDGAARVWDCASGALRHEFQLEQPAPASSCVAFGVCGKSPTLAVGYADGTARLWDLGLGQCTAELISGHSGAVLGIDVSRDGQFVATASEDGSARLWATDDGTCVGVLSIPGKPAACNVVRFGSRRTSSLLAVGTASGAAHAFALPACTLAHSFEGHTGSIKGMSIGENGEVLATGSADRSIRTWKLRTGEYCRSLPGGGGVLALSFSSSGAANLASATAKGKLKVWGIVPNGVRGAAGMFAKSTASGGGR